jgi:hypothetical protein
LNDTSQPQTSASALRTSSPTSSSPQAAQAQPKGPKSGWAEVTIVFNQAPLITNILSDLGRLDAGDRTQLRLIAHDPDGDSLTYAWITECDGSFDHPPSPNPVFTLDAPSPAGSCGLVVTVADGHGGEGKGILTLSTAPSPTVVVGDPSP